MKDTMSKEKKRRNSAPFSSKCLGPIADLEQHLPVEWWKTLFNSLYLKTDGDVVENNEATEEEVSLFIKCTALDKGSSILDLCCGQGRHSLELAKRGYAKIFGIDRSRYLIRLAKDRAKKQGYSIKFSEGDARKLRIADQSFHCVAIFGNSFGYFEQEVDDHKVLEEVNRVLTSSGLIYLDISNGAWVKENFEKRSWEWIDEELMVCRERHLAADKKRLISREIISHAEKGVLTDQIYAERLYTFEEIKEHLRQVGFEKIELKEQLAGISTRNQDLGMMANRLIITAEASKRAKKVYAARNKIDCTVLLGDPRLADEVKRDGKFNEEDFETVRRMKGALEKVEGFDFTYLDDHDALLESLREKRPSFVMNLCDEGWRNLASMELHIPSYLELLQIPYSGSGPECLAICYDKAIVRSIAKEMEIEVPSEIWLDPSNQSVAIPSIFPALIKPALGDSSIGITQNAVVTSSEELVTYYDRLKSLVPGVAILIQEFLSGREFSVGVIGNGDALELLPILEVDYSNLPPNLPKILGYESKWIAGSPYWDSIRYNEARLSEEMRGKLIDTTVALYHRLNCRDYARFDFRMDGKGIPKLLEVNPNPGWCWDGKMAMMAQFMGVEYSQLLEKILKAAVDRYPHLH